MKVVNRDEVESRSKTMFRFQLGQTVYYLINGIIHNAPIYTRMIVENLHDDRCVTSEQESIFMYFGNSRINYRTIHGVFDETNLYETIEEASHALYLFQLSVIGSVS